MDAGESDEARIAAAVVPAPTGWGLTEVIQQVVVGSADRDQGAGAALLFLIRLATSSGEVLVPRLRWFMFHDTPPLPLGLTSRGRATSQFSHG